jgi:hypothetical protein
LLASGSRWSPFFCRPCQERVRALNHAVGRLVIPVGRRSMMNGIAAGGRGDVPGELELETIR